MIAKVVVFCAFLALSSAQYGGYGHGHGHAVSSQNFVKHEAPHHKIIVPVHHHEPIHAPAHKGHAISSQSFVSHNTPVHHAPVYHHAPVHHAPIYHHAPVHHAPIHHEEEHHHHPAYKFEYSVHDDHTKDIKSQSEHRDGDKVDGHYSLLQPDGHIRNVNYHADKHSGFNAEVTYTHPGHHQGYHH